MSMSVSSSTNNDFVSNKHECMMNSLKHFYSDESNLSIIMNILNGESRISLRIIDWFVTNYSKKNNITYIVSNDNKLIEDMSELTDFHYHECVVYLNYKSQLKGYQKKYFDPFCRNSRIKFYYNEEDYFYTTVGQLNFFRWAITECILQYIEKHLEEIEQDMNGCYRAIYNVNGRRRNSSKKSEDSISSSVDSETSSSSRRRRHELSACATKTLSRSNVKIVMTFD
jgi:hypothetical protein